MLASPESIKRVGVRVSIRALSGVASGVCSRAVRNRSAVGFAAVTDAGDRDGVLVSLSADPAVVSGQNGGTTTFKYDPFGRRIQKSGPLGTTNYLYDGADLLAEVDNSGNGLARYTQGKSIDEPLAQLRSDITSFYDQDGLGSVTSLSNPSGVLANTYTYDSFGRLTASTGTLSNPFQYAGRESEQEAGIYYNRARYYDQSSGRFVSEDPIGFGGGENFFRYANDNPMTWSDPLGLSANDVATLMKLYRNTVDRMNRNGERFPGKGPWRGRWNDFRWHRYPWGKKYKSCNEQAYEVQGDMAGRKYDANWTFEVVHVDGVMGWALMATSADPNDPAILFNPWEDSVTINPGGNPSDPFGINSLMNGPD